MYTEFQVKEICEVCRKHNIVLISDEIYSQITFTDKKFVSFAWYLPERTIITGGLSKIFSAGGYRLGFMAIPKQMEKIIKPVVAMFSETFSSVCAPVQHAAVAAYKDSKEIKDYVETCRQIHKQASLFLYGRFTSMGLSSSKPEGAFYLFVDFENYKEELAEMKIENARKLTEYIIDNHGIAMLPGDDFYMPSGLS